MIYLLFLVVPVVELVLLIEVGRAIGTVPTLALIVATGVIGATLARHQGLAVISRLRREVGAGHLPADALLDGVLILVAGAFLVTPGVLTDAVGFLLLIPLTRVGLKRYLKRRFENAVKEGRVNAHAHFGPEPHEAPPGRGVVIDQDDVP
jgi:UPF0716 protein FxsA